MLALGNGDLHQIWWRASAPLGWLPRMEGIHADLPVGWLMLRCSRADDLRRTASWLGHRPSRRSSPCTEDFSRPAKVPAGKRRFYNRPPTPIPPCGVSVPPEWVNGSLLRRFPANWRDVKVAERRPEA